MFRDIGPYTRTIYRARDEYLDGTTEHEHIYFDTTSSILYSSRTTVLWSNLWDCAMGLRDPKMLRFMDKIDSRDQDIVNNQRYLGTLAMSLETHCQPILQIDTSHLQSRLSEYNIQHIAPRMLPTKLYKQNFSLQTTTTDLQKLHHLGPYTSTQSAKYFTNQKSCASEVEATALTSSLSLARTLRLKIGRSWLRRHCFSWKPKWSKRPNCPILRTMKTMRAMRL